MTSDPDNQSTAENPVGRFMVAAGAVIELNSTGKILLVRRSPDLDWHPGEWETCYGRLAQFEDAETGLKREVKEELGITDLHIIRVLRVWHLFRGSESADNECIGITYFCNTLNPDITLSAEHDTYLWIDPDAALGKINIPGIREDISRYINIKSGKT
jgi:8-oxo-dGTP pyrophosphatase MutT (NUDIX family)